MEEWQDKAIEMYKEYKKATDKYQKKGIKELALIAAGKAIALSKLLEHFDVKMKF